MGSFEASYKDFNLHILSAELGGLRCIHYPTVVCAYHQDQQRGGGIEHSAMWNKSWAGAQAPSHKWGRKRSYVAVCKKQVLWQIHKIIICIKTTSLLSKLELSSIKLNLFPGHKYNYSNITFCTLQKLNL